MWRMWEKKSVTALSLTEVGTTVGGMGLESRPCVGHVELKMPFGNLSWNIGQQSGDRAWLEGCIFRSSAQSWCLKLQAWMGPPESLRKRAKDWALVLSSNSESLKWGKKTAKDIWKDWPVRWGVSQEHGKGGVSEAGEEHEWRRSCATFWEQVKEDENWEREITWQD